MLTIYLGFSLFLFVQATQQCADCKQIPLIIAKDNGLIYVDLEDLSSHRISRLGMPFSIDYTDKTSQEFQLFWSDLKGNGITMGTLKNKQLTNITQLINTNGARVEGISINWMKEQIYWVLSDAGIIEVANLNGEFRAPLVTGLSSPRAIAVDPEARFLFWSDTRNEVSHIQRSNLAGLDIVTVTEVADAEVNSVNGLTLDYSNRLIYWVETRSEGIHKITYDGHNYEIIRKQSYLKCPVGIAIHDNQIIWSDQDSGKVILAANEEESVLYETYSNLYGIQLLAKRWRSTTHDTCDVNNGGCSHLCFSDRNSIYCRCAYGFTLATDGKTCQKVTTELDVIFDYGKKHEHMSSIFTQDLENPIWPTDPVNFLYKDRYIIGVDRDQTEGVYYLLDRSSKEVLEVNNEHVRSLFTVSSDVKAFVVDYTEHVIYVAVNGSHPHIAACSIDEQLCKPFVTEAISNPTDVALQIQKRNLILLDESKGEKKILLVNLNNNLSSTIAEGRDLCCLTVDVKTDWVWWIDRVKSVVVSNHQDNSGSTSIVYSKYFHPISLVVFDNVIYIASNTSIIMTGTGNQSASIYNFKNKGTISAIKAFRLAKNAVNETESPHTVTSIFETLSTLDDTSHKIEINTEDKEKWMTEKYSFSYVAYQNYTDCVQICVHEGDCVVTNDKELMCRCSQSTAFMNCAQQNCNCIHGDCVVKNDEFGCICDHGFEGSICDVPSCDNLCVFGSCNITEYNTSACSCYSEWGGLRCNEPKMQITQFCFNWCEKMVNYTEEKAELCRCHGQQNMFAIRLNSIIIGVMMYMITVLLLFVIVYLCVITACKKHTQSVLESEQNESFLSDQKSEVNAASNECKGKYSGLFFENLKKLPKKITLLCRVRLSSGRADGVQVLSNNSCSSTESEV